VGDVVIDLEPLFSTARSGILIHLDANKERSPGTAGCLGLLSQDDMDRVLMWFDQNSPTRCYVDYGLGTVELPGGAQ
jgi:lysozyme